MSQLAKFFSPESIAVFGASEKTDSMGGIVVQNLTEGGYPGRLVGINLKGYDQVFGVPCVTGLEKLDYTVDLAILCLPLENLSRAIKHLSKYGVKAAMLLTGGISRRKTQGYKINQDISDLAASLGVRLMGPNSMGLIVPDKKINASFGHLQAKPGNIAFVGQSAAVGSALLDWGTGKGIGFSHFVTVGSGADVDVADLVDYLAADRRVKSILLHIEQVRNARRLMTALRAASKSKKVLALRSSIQDQTPKGLRNRDRVDYRFFRRAGVLEVTSFDGLFSGLEILSRVKPLFFESLAIVSNGLGPALMAKNNLVQKNGALADLASVFEQPHLGEDLWYHEEVGNNPVILPPNASAEEYKEILQQLDRTKNLGAILLIHTPNKRSKSEDLAKELEPVIRRCRHMVLTIWLGNETVQEARQLFDESGLLNFDTPSEATDAFMIMVHHERNQRSLNETPPSQRIGNQAEKSQVRKLIKSVKNAGRDYLTWLESRQVISTYGFSLVPSKFGPNLKELTKKLTEEDYPASLRLVHQAYCYPFAYNLNPRQRWRGVHIQLDDEAALMNSGHRLLDEQALRFPDSKVLGFGVQPMRRKIDYLQFSIGITRDAAVGPLILFGEGGAAADILADRRFGLPPLNANHARKLIFRSHGYSLLCERSLDPDADVEALSQAIMSVSQITVDHPEINGLEANILLMPDHSVLALGVAISLGERVSTAIAPYPSELEEVMELKNGVQLTLRPIKAEDEEALQTFFGRMSPEELRYRFFGSRLNFEHRELAAMCQIDYEREMAFVATDQDNRIWGEIRTWKDVNHSEIEFAVMVDPDTQGQGFGTQLMQRMIRFSHEQGVEAIVAEIMSDNEPMLHLAKRCGFKQQPPVDGVTSVRLELNN